MRTQQQIVFEANDVRKSFVHQIQQKSKMRKKLLISLLVRMWPTLGKYSKKRNGNFWWHLPLSAAPPPPLIAIIFIHFLPHFFPFQLNLTYMKRILHSFSVKNINFKSSYNWFKIDILRLLWPPTAIFSHIQLFMITSTTICI